MSGRSDVVVIGGGFAGLSAAVALAERGLSVHLLEAKPTLGGRAYSFYDEASGDSVDNGQHVLMGCYDATLDFLRRIGAADKLFFHRRLEVEMIKPGGARAWLRSAPLPGPSHMAMALLGYKHLALSERLRLLAGTAKLLSIRAREPASLERRTVAELMGLLRQGEQARRCFWYPLAIAVLNELPELASALLLTEVIRRAFFARRADACLVLPTVGLSELYCEPARRCLERCGATVQSHTQAEELELGPDGRVCAVRTRDGGRLEAACLIAAIPHTRLVAMLPEALRADPFFSRLDALTSSPIICAHLWFDRPITHAPMVGFIDTTTQWLFNKHAILGDRTANGRDYLSFVISGARGLVDRPSSELVALVLADLNRMIPRASAAKLVNALVIKEKQATISPNCGSHAARPSVKTPVDNLFLAGDWIQTGLPPTIESAVISGNAAAAAAWERRRGN